MDPLREFQDSLIAQRVVQRVAAMEHPSEEARKKYLRDHPKAESRNHTVKQKDESSSKPSPSSTKGPDHDQVDGALDKASELLEKGDSAAAGRILNKAKKDLEALEGSDESTEELEKRLKGLQEWGG